MKPVEGTLDPGMVSRVALLLRSIEMLPPMCWYEVGPLRGIFAVRHPVALMFRGPILAGAWVSVATEPAKTIDEAIRLFKDAIPILGRGGRFEIAILSAVVALDEELRARIVVPGVDDRERMLAANDAIDRWLFAQRPSDPPLDAKGASYGTPRAGHRRGPGVATR